MKKILVIGDSCIDEYVYGYSDRLCPEAPVPVFEPSYTKKIDGMAMNVLNNIENFKLVNCDIVTNRFVKPIKIRYVDDVSNQMLLRVDNKDKIDRIPLPILNNINFLEYDAVIISDYNKGFLIEQDIEYISQFNTLTFLDTKKKIGNWAKKIDFIKINMKEYVNNRGWLDHKYRNDLIITHSNNGAFHINNGKKTLIPVENEVDVIDVSGAGDTFLAGFVIKYLETNDVEGSVKFANRCASWVITQKGVVVVDPQKI